MKVVLFCGGMGMRLREHSEALPKPIVSVGHRPIIWHVMKYYAHFGQKDFILCLGYKSAVIKEYFLRYNEAMSNDFVMSEGGKNLQLLGTDIQDWTITFADTGLNSNIGQRLEGGRAIPARRGSLSGQLRGRSHGFSSPCDDRSFHEERKGRRLPLRATHTQLSRGLTRRGAQRHRNPARLPVRTVYQRRLLHLSKRDLQLHPRRRGTCRGTVPQARATQDSSRPTGTTASGSRWIPSRTSSCSRTCTPAASRHGKSGRMRATRKPCHRRWRRWPGNPRGIRCFDLSRPGTVGVHV